jgi:S1-C subfamily serine protease
VVLEGPVASGDEPAAKSTVAAQPKSRIEPAPKSNDPRRTGEQRVVAAGPAEPARRPVNPQPAVAAADTADASAGSRGSRLSVPVLAGVAGGVLVLIVLVSVVAYMAFTGLGGQKSADTAAAPREGSASVAIGARAADLITQKGKTASRPQPAAGGRKPGQPAHSSAEISVADLILAPPPAAPPPTPASARAGAGLTAAAPAPTPEPASEISVGDLVPAQPTVSPPVVETAIDSAVVAQARAGAAAVTSRDDGAGKSLSTAEIVAESEPSVALIKGQGSSGTGFLVAPDLVATNAHVIDDEFISDLEVHFVSADAAHKVALSAELLYEDPGRDLAFLAVKTDLKPLRIARTYAFRKGEDITVIGNPGFGENQVLENAISRGVMSTKTQIEGQDFYQLGIAINPGNSGGPVFDSSGRVIGVATLKAAKQEATGFSIPIEDFHAALARVAKESTADSERYRSRHRLRNAVKGLASGGAILSLVLDLRQANAGGKNPVAKELLGKLEPVASELDKELFPSLTTNAARVKNDALATSSMKRGVGEMADNFKQLRTAYSSRKMLDARTLQSCKQNLKRLTVDLSKTLKLEVPEGMLAAFDDHTPSQPTIVLSPNLGSYGSRLRQRGRSGTSIGPRPPLGPNRPSLRDRLGR